MYYLFNQKFLIQIFIALNIYTNEPNYLHLHMSQMIWYVKDIVRKPNCQCVLRFANMFKSNYKSKWKADGNEETNIDYSYFAFLFPSVKNHVHAGEVVERSWLRERNSQQTKRQKVDLTLGATPVETLLPKAETSRLSLEMQLQSWASATKRSISGFWISGFGEKTWSLVSVIGFLAVWYPLDNPFFLPRLKYGGTFSLLDI